MGAVWLAEDTRLHRQVALKMVRPADHQDDASRTRLMREARAAAALNHAHLATVHDLLEQDGQIVIVFEYVEGETLHARIARGRIPALEAVEIASQIAKGLIAAHAHGIVHRDLKPANVIIGAGGQVKVLDFGIARMLGLGTTQTGAAGEPSTGAVGLVGTASYAAPEQMVSGAVDERADLYALGVVLFEMISGQRPFLGSDPVQLASSKLSKEAPALSSTAQLVPPALDRLVASLLARDRDRRPASAADALAQLRAVYGTPSTGSLFGRRGRPRLVAVTATLLLIVLVGLGLWRLRTAPVSPGTSSPPVIAVMPLANISGDPAREFIAAGIAESLISSLAALPSVTVLSRASVTDARTRAKDESALARELGATYLVSGSVQESGGTLKVSLTLVKPDRTVAWGDSVEGAFDRIFELQSRLASALTSALVVRVSAADRERMNAPPTTSPDALAAYWQGSALLERTDVRGNVDAAIAAFNRALVLDARFALAHAGLGQAYRRKYIDTREEVWAQRAIEATSVALGLDPDRAEVRYALALTLSGGGRLSEAVAELNRALAIRPNYEEARRQLGAVLAEQQQIDAAVVEFRRAIALRPASPLGYSAMGLALFAASRYAQAAEAFEELVKVAPDSFLGYQQLGTVYHAMGRVDDALANYRKAIAIRPSAPANTNIGALLHQRGDFEGAVRAYRQALAIRANSTIAHRNLGDALLRLNRTREARAAYLDAVRYAEAELKVNPSDTRTVSALAVYLQKSGQPEPARKRIAEALAMAPDSAEVQFRAAVVHALSGDRERALTFLDRAAANGYSRKTIATDDDLVTLHQDPRFKQFSKE